MFLSVFQMQVEEEVSTNRKWQNRIGGELVVKFSYWLYQHFPLNVLESLILFRRKLE